MNDHTLDDFWEATVGNSASEFFNVQDVILRLVYDNGRIKTLDYGIDEVRNGDFLRVQDNNSMMLSYLTFDSTRALRTLVTNTNIASKITNVSDIATALKQSQPQQMSISGAVNINRNTLIDAIVEALGGNESNIKLKQFIDGSLQGSNGSYPPTVRIRNEDGKNINVRVSNYQLFSI